MRRSRTILMVAVIVGIALFSACSPDKQAENNPQGSNAAQKTDNSPADPYEIDDSYGRQVPTTNNPDAPPPQTTFVVPVTTEPPPEDAFIIGNVEITEIEPAVTPAIEITVGGDAIVPGSFVTAEDGLATPDARINYDYYSALRPYEVGQIMIIMYHGLYENSDSSYQRSPSDFWRDMEALYERGFRLAKLSDVMSGNISTEAGFTPVVFTFDDGLSSAFSLVEENGVLSPDPNCAVALMTRFYEQHPDFGLTAAFFINGYAIFSGAGTVEQRLRYLVDNGFEVGNHTLDHPVLKELDADELQRQVSVVDGIIKDALPGYPPVGLAYPYGSRPDDDGLKPLVLAGSYGGHSYEYAFGLREGQSGAHSCVFNKRYDALNVPRVRGSDDSPTDLWDTIRFYDQNPEYRYVSDGDPRTIAVPEEYAGNINYDAPLLAEQHMQVIIYP